MKKAFTLAEVLITLGIIGVVAALTMPTLTGNTSDAAIVSQLKKTYSLLGQADLMASTEQGEDILSINMKGTSNAMEASKAMLEYYKPYLKITKTCTDNTQKGCFPKNVMYKRLNGQNYGILDNLTYNNRVNARLADGTSIAFFTWGNKGCTYTMGTLKNVCGQFYVDVNGDKKPNVQGIDYFSFFITQQGIYAEGTHGDVAELVKQDCLNRKTAQGWNCAAWVLETGNLDYLHCNDLDLKTKRSCK